MQRSFEVFAETRNFSVQELGVEGDINSGEGNRCGSLLYSYKLFGGELIQSLGNQIRDGGFRVFLQSVCADAESFQIGIVTRDDVLVVLHVVVDDFNEPLALSTNFVNESRQMVGSEE